MADAVHGARELICDAGIYGRIVATEAVRGAGYAARHCCRKLGEDDTLVFRGLNNLRGLEDLVVAPLGMQCLDLLRLEVRFTMPDCMYGRQGDVLVSPVIARDFIREKAFEAEIQIRVAVLP